MIKRFITLACVMLLTSHISHAEITNWDGLTESIGKKVIIGCFAAASAGIFYDGMKKAFWAPKPPTICYNTKVGDPFPIRMRSKRDDGKIHFKQFMGIVEASIGFTGLIASWFANKW